MFPCNVINIYTNTQKTSLEFIHLSLITSQKARGHKTKTLTDQQIFLYSNKIALQQMNIWKKSGEEKRVCYCSRKMETVIYFIASISIKHILSLCSSEKFRLVIEQGKVSMFFLSKTIFKEYFPFISLLFLYYILTSFSICSCPPPFTFLTSLNLQH